MISKVLAVFDTPHADPVAKDSAFLGSAWPVSIIILTYLLIVKKYGIRFMEQRQPYDIKKIIICYNFSQVIYNAIVFGFLFYYLFIDQIHDLSCMTTLSFNDPNKNIERLISYVYFINKIIDLLDTIFFVLRKSYKQITFLHVYHHILMIYGSYWVIRAYGFGAQFLIMILANTFVHVVMYFYYMISAIYTDLKGSLWWKKYITGIQIIQFVILVSQSVYILVFNSECQFPLALHCVIIIGGSIFIILFSNFYLKSYVKSGNKKQQ